MKEEGGRGNKNDYTNVSLRLFIIIHQYIDAVTSVAPYLSPSLSLSLSSTYTHTYHTSHTTHTLTQSKAGRYQLIRFSEFEEICF